MAGCNCKKKKKTEEMKDYDFCGDEEQ